MRLRVARKVIYGHFQARARAVLTRHPLPKWHRHHTREKAILRCRRSLRLFRRRHKGPWMILGSGRAVPLKVQLQ